MINEGNRTFLLNDERHLVILTNGAALCHLLDDLVSCRSRLRSRYRQVPIFGVISLSQHLWYIDYIFSDYFYLASCVKLFNLFDSQNFLFHVFIVFRRSVKIFFLLVLNVLKPRSYFPFDQVYNIQKCFMVLTLHLYVL